MHGFRLRFHAPPGVALEPSEQNLHLVGALEPMLVKQLPPRSDALPSDVGVFVVDADGFASEQDARSFGERLKRSLSVYSARHRLGFDVGTDKATSSLGRAVREQIREDSGVDVRPTVHGLDVFDTSIPVKRVEARGRLSVLRPIANLPTELAADFPCRALPPKVALALDLYNGVAYEQDAEVRFLSLVTVVEAMAVRRAQNSSIQEFLDSCLTSLERRPLTPAARDTLRSGIGNLRTESISSACRTLVNQAGADAELFKRAYKARSELLHDGQSETYPDLPRQPHVLEDLVQAVLLHQIAVAMAEDLPDARSDASRM